MEQAAYRIHGNSFIGASQEDVRCIWDGFGTGNTASTQWTGVDDPQCPFPISDSVYSFKSLLNCSSFFHDTYKKCIYYTEGIREGISHFP